MSRRPPEKTDPSALDHQGSLFDFQSRRLGRPEYPAIPSVEKSPVHPSVQPSDRLAFELQSGELQALREALRRARARYLELFDFAPVPYFVFDEQHQIQEINRAGVELLSEEKGALKFRPFFTFLSEFDRPKFHRHVSAVLQRGERAEVDLQIAIPGRHPQSVRLVSRPIHAEDGDQWVCLSTMVVLQGPSAPVDRSRPGVTLLLVDDEPLVRDITARLVESLGYEVQEASNGAEAIAIFRRSPEKFACLLVDFTMPEMDGVTLIQELRQVRPGLPALLMSGMLDAAAFIDPHPPAPTSFLQKPFCLAGLEQLLKSLHLPMPAL